MDKSSSINHMSQGKSEDVPVVPEGVGNTKQPPTKWWAFTFNNYSEKDLEMFQDTEFEYVFQKEVGESGNEHLQGTVACKPKKRFSTLKNQFPKEIHWSKVKDIQASIRYCSDESKRKPGTKVYTNMRLPAKINVIKELWVWQLKLWDLLQKEPDERTINWYWEDTGGVGKTAFAKWLVVKHDAFYVCGSARDMKCGLASLAEKNYGWFPKIVILDLPRDSQGCSYKGLEQIKNGIFYSTKYESGMLVFNSPHVVVFANDEPDEHKMSDDRWNVVEIGGGTPRTD